MKKTTVEFIRQCLYITGSSSSKIIFFNKFELFLVHKVGLISSDNQLIYINYIYVFVWEIWDNIIANYDIMTGQNPFPSKMFEGEHL